MLNVRTPAIKSQALIGASLFALGLWLAWQTGGKIVAGDFQSIIFAVLGFAACAVGVSILRDWRSGFYLFLVWLLFEDLPASISETARLSSSARILSLASFTFHFLFHFASTGRNFFVRSSCSRLFYSHGWLRGRSLIQTPPVSCTDYWASNSISTMSP